MTRQMGKLLGNNLREYILLDQSRKEEQYGSILRIRVRINVFKPLRRCVAIQIDGSMVIANIRYEKLPLTCFLSEMMDHVEDQCEKFCGKK